MVKEELGICNLDNPSMGCSVSLTVSWGEMHLCRYFWSPLESDRHGLCLGVETWFVKEPGFLDININYLIQTS